MRVLILSTYENAGGAAIAANRLKDALQKSGVEVSMLTMRGKHPWSFLMERLAVLVANGFSTKDLWSQDICLFGQDITHTKEYQEADVIHLHWINQGFLSLSAIKGFIKDGKKVVWTMHDAWNSMGVYHLKIQQQNTWLERWNTKRKARLYQSGKIQFVACSEWLKNECLQTALMQNQNIAVVPNPINTSVFKPVVHQNKRRVLFVAQKVDNPMKGMYYLEQAAKQLPDVEVVALGRDIPYISDKYEMAKLVASMDAFVLPSLSENLPNTIMEAMACGVPCVGFNVGGIPEMIDHRKNGYVAEYKNITDLANGIRYVLDENIAEELRSNSEEKVKRCYSQEAVAAQYIKIYNE